MCGSVTKRRECTAQFDGKYHLKNQQWHKWIKGIMNKERMYIPTCDEFCINAPQKKPIVEDSCFPCGVWLDLLCPLRFPTCLFSKASLNELNCKHDFTSFKTSCSLAASCQPGERERKESVGNFVFPVLSVQSVILPQMKVHEKPSLSSPG